MADLSVDLCFAGLLGPLPTRTQAGHLEPSAVRGAALPFRDSPPSARPRAKLQIAARRVQDATGRNKLALVGRTDGRAPAIVFLVTGTLERDLPRAGPRGVVLAARERLSDLDVVVHIGATGMNDEDERGTLCRFWICPDVKSRLDPDPTASWSHGEARVRITVRTAPAAGDRVSILELRIEVRTGPDHS